MPSALEAPRVSRNATTARSGIRRCAGGGLALLALLAVPTGAEADTIAYSCVDGRGDICLIDPDSGGPTNLTQSSEKDDQWPAWSPDGSQIAFRANYSAAGDSDIFTLNASDPAPVSGINVTQTTDRNEEFGPPSWSGDGSRLTFAANYHAGGDTDVFVSPAAGTSTPLPIGATSGYENHPVFSPDGTRIAYDKGSAIYVANADGTGTPAALAGGGGTMPSWSPDGTRIAFNADNVVRVMKADGTGQPVDMTFPGGDADTPAWSADSTRLAWTGRPSTSDPTTVHVAPADGSSVGVDIPMPAGVIVPHNPSFSPDGSRVAFDAYVSGPGDIYVAPADGSATARAITGAGTGDVQAVWKPDPSTTTPPTTTPPTTTTTPPTTTPQTPVTVSFASYSKPKINAGFVRIVWVDCSAGPTANAIAAGCDFSGEVKSSGKTMKLPGSRAKPKPRKIMFAKGSAHVADGQGADLPLKLTKAGRKLVKPGAKLKLKVSVTLSRPDTETTTDTRTLKLKIPRRH